MNPTILYKTSGNNNYLFDFNKSSVQLVHPLIELIHKNTMAGNDFPIKTISYYEKKYNFLKRHGWFSNSSIPIDICEKLNQKEIIRQLANTNQLTLEVTDMCNLKCKYCGYGYFYDDHDERNNKKLSFLKAKLIIDYLFDLWGSELNKSKNKINYISFYGGEPLLNIRLIKKIVQYINGKSNRPRKIKFSMTTNAYLLDLSIDFLIEHGFELLLSVDGNKWNNSYRVDKNDNSTYEKVIGNIDTVKLKYPSYFETNVNFNSVLHNRNSIDSIYNFIHNRYKKKPSIGELNTTGIIPEKQTEFNSLFQQTEKSLFSSVNKKQLINELFISLPYIKDLSRFIRQYASCINEDYNDFFIDKNKKSYSPTGTCLPFSRKIFVTVNGKILPCETIGHQFALGEIEDTRIQLDCNKITKYYNDIYNGILKQCSQCYFQKGCIQCIFNMPMIKKNHICQSSMNKKKFSSFLSINTSILEKNNNYYNRILTQTRIN